MGAPELVIELSSAVADLAPVIAPDGLTIYMARPVGGTPGFEIHVSTRADRNSPWTTPVVIAELSSPEEDTNAQPSAEGLELWFTSKRGGTVERQLYVSTRAATGAAWSMPVAATGLNVGPNIYTGDAWPSADGKRLYFASNRAGGEGTMDIWRVERPTPTSFGIPENMAELNDSQSQHDPWLSADERVIYFESRAAGSTRIVMSTR